MLFPITERKGVVADLFSLPSLFLDSVLSGNSAPKSYLQEQADIRLAATLGPKTKRITRKQLTGVDLTKTCELIAEPPEPLALRLSGCLLVGVARSAACALISHELMKRVYNQNYDLFYTVRPFDF